MAHSMLSSALKYAELGFDVIPVKPHEKLLFEGNDYFDPSRDKEIIIHWWKRVPNANIGLPTSLRHNSLVVIDIDIKDGIDGRISLNQFLKEHNLQLSKTSVVKSGTGFHLYYRNSTGMRLWGNKDVLPNVDIRAENAYIVAPPSIHKNKSRYKWISGSINELANVDDTVLELLKLVERNTSSLREKATSNN